MLRWKSIFAVAAVLTLAPGVSAFSLLGPGGAEGNPAKLWQLPAQNGGWDIGYNQVGDIGSPVDPVELYRWNIPEITYAFDSTFIFVFGTNGIKAVESAFRILNDLPPMSRTSPDLSEFPLSTTQLHYEAAQLGLVDLKSVALTFLVEELGLADPIRWNFAIRQRISLPDDFGDYTVVKYNFDPVTIRETSYINGQLWTYDIFEDQANQISDAIERRPLGLENEPINFPIAANTFPPFLSGYFYNGLTRDDVGGLRFLYRPRTEVTETLLPGTFPGPQGWLPFIGTNFLGSNFFATNIVVGTNNLATIGVRGGINKIRFRRVNFDSLIGQGFTPFTNSYVDRVMSTNGQFVSQTVRRPVLTPDIVFTAVDSIGAGFIGQRTDTTGWINNDIINGHPSSVLGGPGVITGPIVITFNYKLPFLRNVTPFFTTEPSITDTNARTFGLVGPIWASFDGTTNAPIIYPAYKNYTLEDVRAAARGNGQ